MPARRQKNSPLDADGKQRQYRLRKIGTAHEYVNYYKSADVSPNAGYVANSQRPTFNARGKIFTTFEEAEDELSYYALRRLRYPYDKADFPDLEIVVSVVEIERIDEGNTPSDAEIKKLDAFSNLISKEFGKRSIGDIVMDGDYFSEFAFAQKMVFRREPFRYILVTKGVIDRSVMKATASKARIGAVGQMTNSTICCFAVDTDADLTFARMALNEQLATIWDYKKSKLVFGRPVSKYIS